MVLIGGITGKSTTERLISLLSAQNAKIFALTLVIGCIGYHGLLHIKYGSDSCTWLLTSGRYKGDHEWQPYGCMLHRYTRTDTRHCLRRLASRDQHNTFLFIGDERLKQLYQYFVGATRPGARAHNASYADTQLKLMVQFTYCADVSSDMVRHFRQWERWTTPPSVIIAGPGLGMVSRHNHTTDAHLEEYRINITRLVQPADRLAQRGAVVLWKLLEPVDTKEGVSNADINLYNMAAYQILTHSYIKVWNSERLTASGAPGPRGGLALSDTALRHDTQILLNMYCNRHMHYSDGSCCAARSPHTALQLFVGAGLLVCIVLASSKILISWLRQSRLSANGYTPVRADPQPSQEASMSPVTALARLGLVMAYFFLCDRTNFFMKDNKYYSDWSFWLPVGYVLALGLFFTDDSKSTEVLHREQTSEWKGWMQLVVLVYHVTGASKVLPIYMLVRAIVSAYLFLTGYGHLCSVWRSADTSLVRYLRVIFRLNFLTVVLCVAMNRPYQFYNFVPLVSFWVTLMFGVLALPPHLLPAAAHTPESRPYQYVYLCGKLAGLLAVVTVLYMSEVFFQKIFVMRPWRVLFVDTNDDIHQWWLRWKQDRYSVTYGMIAGLLVCASRRHGWLDDSSRADLLAPRRAIAVSLAAALAISLYVAFTFLCSSAADCDEIHSYIAFVPVTAYVVLRNVPGALRTRHSSLFAWVGDISLELFASQSHIWLAADTHGVLVLVPDAPVLNLMLTSYIFVCAAHELRAVTAVLTLAAVPGDWRRALRNAGLFLAVLVPVYMHDNVF